MRAIAWQRQSNAKQRQIHAEQRKAEAQLGFDTQRQSMVRLRKATVKRSLARQSSGKAWLRHAEAELSSASYCKGYRGHNHEQRIKRRRRDLLDGIGGVRTPCGDLRESRRSANIKEPAGTGNTCTALHAWGRSVRIRTGPVELEASWKMAVRGLRRLQTGHSHSHMRCAARRTGRGLNASAPRG